MASIQALRFWWVVITILKYLMLQLWYHNTAQALMNALLYFRNKTDHHSNSANCYSCFCWLKYMFVKLDLVTVAKFCFHFSRYVRAKIRQWLLTTQTFLKRKENSALQPRQCDTSLSSIHLSSAFTFISCSMSSAFCHNSAFSLKLTSNDSFK